MTGYTNNEEGNKIQNKETTTKKKQKFPRTICDCPRCKEYLSTNILCKIGRDTSKIKYCKWYYAIKKTGEKPKIITNRTMLDVINSINESLSEQKKQACATLHNNTVTGMKKEENKLNKKGCNFKYEY